MSDFKRLVPPSGPDAPVEDVPNPTVTGRVVQPDGSVQFGPRLALPPPMGVAPIPQDNDAALRVRPDPGPGTEISEPPQPEDFAPPPEYRPVGTNSRPPDVHLCKTCSHCWERLVVGEFETAPGGPRGRFERWCMQPPYLIDLREREIAECNLYNKTTTKEQG